MLTARERQVANAVVMGHRRGVIAAQLGLSLEGFKSHLRNIFDKTGCGTQVELVAFLWAHPRYLDEVAR